MCAKDHRLFNLTYPQINKVRNSDHMVDVEEQKINKQNYFVPLTKQQLTTSVITNPTGIRTYSRVFNPNACFLGFTTEGEVVVEMLCRAVFVDNDAGVSVGIKGDNVAEEFNGPFILPPSIL